MNPIEQQKKQLRQELRQAGRTLSEHYRRSASERIRRSIQEILEQQLRIVTVASFSALPDEPQLSQFIQSELQYSWVLPRIDERSSMSFHHVNQNNLDDLTATEFGLLEPDPEIHPEVMPEQIDAILVPASGLTRDGRRIGKGGGYYDRYLPRLRTKALKIGVVYETQIRESLPTDTHDCKVGWIVTEAYSSRASK